MSPRIVIATLDGRAYYTLGRLLKEAGLKFESLAPGQEPHQGPAVIITTKKEKSLIHHPNVICLEDLGQDTATMRHRIRGHLYGGKDSTFVVGIDPGERIGVASHYLHSEVEVGVFESIDTAVEHVTQLVEYASAGRKVIRVGYGNPDLAEDMLGRLRGRNLHATFEIVDERGTSSLTGTRRKKETRDQKSARMIALRRGRRIS